ncbi:MAG TPA: EpsD family peptidyl-prolyl cis-trans isomerase [Rhodocyclaceae bacterium]|nr:EpsD family peptidyl-prolyl cis-trans isomerase [Rhodocyclaceae bacterium]
MLVASALTACGDKAGEGKPASQVAAKVNSGEISIHQINFVLQHMAGLTPEKTAEAKRKVLDGLVDQELAVQQALEAKLDRDPKIMQTMEAARREILARAYLEQAVAGKNRPSPEAVRTYYREHPELFADRRIYRVQEIGFPADPKVVAAVRQQIAKSKSGEDLLNGLRAQGIQVAGVVMAKPAEGISLNILPQLSRMKDGQSALFENGERASLVTLIGTTPEPLSEDAARPAIEQFLARRQTDELVKQAMQDLRSKAKIEYVGEFGKEAEAARQAEAAEAARKAKEAEAARQAARAAQATEAAKRAEEMNKAREAAEAERARSPSAVRLPPPSDSSISKGISSLK